MVKKRAQRDCSPVGAECQGTIGAASIGRDGQRLSRLEVCLEAASVYLLDAHEAHHIDHQVDVVHTHWDDACEHVGVTHAQRDLLWGRSVCNPYVCYGYSPA